MPVLLADVGQENIVRKVGGTAEVRQHLADLGFSVGTPVKVISIVGGDVIVKVKESRVAISREMAQKIMV